MRCSHNGSKEKSLESPADAGDDLDDHDRVRLHAAMERAATQVRTGQGISADEAFARLGMRDE
jgi:hypothetical protein